MRRILGILVAPALAGTLALVPAGSAAARSAMPRHGRLSATVDGCRSGPVADERYAAFVGQMMALPGTATMGMRFSLLGRTGRSGGYRRLFAPDLGVWQRSTAGVQIFRYRQVVTNLPPRGWFRAEVDFRWYDAKNHVLHRARRRTPVCQMHDERPKLAVKAIVLYSQLPGDSERYDVTVANQGLGAAPAFQVALSVGGDPLPAQSVDSLGPHQRTVLRFTGPRCPAGSVVLATADPHNRVEQQSRTASVKSVSC